MQFGDLPENCIAIIIRQLDSQSKMNLALVSDYWRAMVVANSKFLTEKKKAEIMDVLRVSRLSWALNHAEDKDAFILTHVCRVCGPQQFNYDESSLKRHMQRYHPSLWGFIKQDLNQDVML